MGRDDATSAGLDPGEVARQLGALLAAIDRGEIEATDMQRAYLAGAAHVLEASAVGAPSRARRPGAARP